MFTVAHFYLALIHDTFWQRKVYVTGHVIFEV